MREEAGGGRNETTKKEENKRGWRKEEEKIFTPDSVTSEKRSLTNEIAHHLSPHDISQVLHKMQRNILYTRAI